MGFRLPLRRLFLAPARCRFLLGTSVKNISLKPPGKGEVFTLGLPYPCSRRRKTRAHFGPAKSPLERSDSIGYSRDKRPDCV